MLVPTCRDEKSLRPVSFQTWTTVACLTRTQRHTAVVSPHFSSQSLAVTVTHTELILVEGSLLLGTLYEFSHLQYIIIHFRDEHSGAQRSKGT